MYACMYVHICIYYYFFSLFLADVQDAWAGKKVHVLLSKIGPYKIFYWDIYQVGPNMEMESEVQCSYFNMIYICMYGVEYFVRQELAMFGPGK